MNTGNGIATKGSSTMHLPSFLCYVIMNTGNGIRENKKSVLSVCSKHRLGKSGFLLAKRRFTGFLIGKRQQERIYYKYRKGIRAAGGGCSVSSKRKSSQDF